MIEEKEIILENFKRYCSIYGVPKASLLSKRKNIKDGNLLVSLTKVLKYFTYYNALVKEAGYRPNAIRNKKVITNFQLKNHNKLEKYNHFISSTYIIKEYKKISKRLGYKKGVPQFMLYSYFDFNLYDIKKNFGTWKEFIKKCGYK